MDTIPRHMRFLDGMNARFKGKPKKVPIEMGTPDTPIEGDEFWEQGYDYMDGRLQEIWSKLPNVGTAEFDHMMTSIYTLNV